LGKLLWASPFIPEFKKLVMPLESLLSSGNAGEWSPECTQAVNDLTKAMYDQVKLVQGDPNGEFYMYVSVERNVGLIATTQEKEGE
jgi:hypothetical protein